MDVPAGSNPTLRLLASEDDFQVHRNSLTFSLLFVTKTLPLQQEILEDPKLADFKEGPVHTIVIDVECLAMLNKIPETAKHLESQLKNELQAIVSRSTQQLIDAGPYPQGDIKLLQGCKLFPLSNVDTRSIIKVLIPNFLPPEGQEDVIFFILVLVVLGINSFVFHI